jgi:Chaperone of endosialidase
MIFPKLTSEEIPVAPRTDERSALDRVRELRGVTWRWRRGCGRPGSRRWMGVLAQDVQAAFPDAVVQSRWGYLKVDYHGLVGALVEAVKELGDRVDELEATANRRVACDALPPYATDQRT